MKLLALLTTNVAMDYLEKHERTAHTSRNLCPNKFGAQGSGVQTKLSTIISKMSKIKW